jgi:asparagine synthase (glutamine-hydrolysing)
MSDVPLGMFLSGGVDSSAIAALMKRMVSDRLQTFSIGYAEQEYSELDFARQVALYLGSDHHEVRIGMDEFFGALPHLIWHEDEPLVWPSSVSLYFVSKLASERVKVVLTGEGSDELFAGYGRYQHYLSNQAAMRLYGLLPAKVRGWNRRLISTSPLLSASLRRKLQHTILGLDGGVESLYLDNFLCAFPEAAQRPLWRNGNDSAGPVYSNYLQYWNARQHVSPLSQLLYADQKTYLVELLMKQDQMSMATSIESRVPLLDHPLVEFAARTPDRLKLHRGRGKHIFKEAVAGLLPPEIIDRKKMGFPTPLRAWLLNDKARPLLDRLKSRNGFLASYFNPDVIHETIERHRSGFEDGTERLWRLLNLELWGEVCLLGNREPAGLSVSR